jgi:hypothetical protein
MKRLLIHVGYPKAASTTLQNGVFLNLHRQKKINFLGRAFESGFYGIKSTRHEYKKWFKEVVGAADARKETLGNLSEEVVNLLSEGLFMNNERHSDQLTGPRLLHNYFSPFFDQIEILIVVRKQQDLIPSYFITQYRRLNNSLSNFLDLHVNGNLSAEGKIFDFHSVAMAYAEVFGKDSVHIVLFEDLVKNREKFSSDLGGAMAIDARTILDGMEETHLNKTIRKGNSLVVRKMQKHSIRAWFHDRLKTISPSLASLALVKLPGVTDEERKRIFESFRESNRRLAGKFELDDSMSGYGYF